MPLCALHTIENCMTGTKRRSRSTASQTFSIFSRNRSYCCAVHKIKNFKRSQFFFFRSLRNAVEYLQKRIEKNRTSFFLSCRYRRYLLVFLRLHKFVKQFYDAPKNFWWSSEYKKSHCKVKIFLKCVFFKVNFLYVEIQSSTPTSGQRSSASMCRS